MPIKMTRRSIGTSAALVMLAAMPAASQRSRPTAASPVSAFDKLDAPFAGYMMVLKFRRSMLSNDNAVRYASLFLNGMPADCRGATVFRNEFDARSATDSARARLNSFLDAIPPRIMGISTFDLGTYDRSVGGFPIGSWHGDGHLHREWSRMSALTAYSKPPTNVGANINGCGIDPYASQRIQVRAVDPANEWYGYFMMPEAAARAYVASHAGRPRRVDIYTTNTVAALEEEPNGWRGITSNSPPALIFNLVGRKDIRRVEDVSTHQVLPGRITFRQTAPEILE